ncbi:DNA polymerase III subunit delta, partial [Burkholderia thailandensis]|nr:DNA polymerase III subunit delta [Burkholderia thailandensis]
MVPKLAAAVARLYRASGTWWPVPRPAGAALGGVWRGAVITVRSGHTVAAGVDWSRRIGASQARSLCGERQLVELRIPSGTPGKDGADALKTLPGADNPHALMLVKLPRLESATHNAASFTAHVNSGVALKAGRVDRRQSPDAFAQPAPPQGERVAPGGSERGGR